MDEWMDEWMDGWMNIRNPCSPMLKVGIFYLFYLEYLHQGHKYIELKCNNKSTDGRYIE